MSTPASETSRQRWDAHIDRIQAEHQSAFGLFQLELGLWYQGKYEWETIKFSYRKGFHLVSWHASGITETHRLPQCILDLVASGHHDAGTSSARQFER